MWRISRTGLGVGLRSLSGQNAVKLEPSRPLFVMSFVIDGALVKRARRAFEDQQWSAPHADEAAIEARVCAGTARIGGGHPRCHAADFMLKG